MQRSFAIVVRVFDGESPYLQSFIDHHRSIGIDQFYVVISPGSSPLCREILAKNKINFFEVKGQKVNDICHEVKEDYVSVLDADEYLHPELIQFASRENFRALQMPWRMTATFNDKDYMRRKKPFFVFPQVKSIMRTNSLTRLNLHSSFTRGEGDKLGLEYGLKFPINHYYLRGVDDLLLKEGGVVALSGATSAGRKPVALSKDLETDLSEFPSRHAKAAFVLRVLELCPKVRDPYQLKIDYEMLSRLHQSANFDLQAAKDSLRQSVESIQKVFLDKSIKRQYKNIQSKLSERPRRVNFQTRVVRVLRKDFEKRQHFG